MPLSGAWRSRGGVRLPSGPCLSPPPVVDTGQLHALHREKAVGSEGHGAGPGSASTEHAPPRSSPVSFSSAGPLPLSPQHAHLSHSAGAAASATVSPCPGRPCLWPGTRVPPTPAQQDRGSPPPATRNLQAKASERNRSPGLQRRLCPLGLRSATSVSSCLLGMGSTPSRAHGRCGLRSCQCSSG